MNIDLPYAKYHSLIHGGLAAIPTARRIQSHDVEIGIVADGSHLTFFSKVLGSTSFAAHTMRDCGDVVINELGAFSIETHPLRRIVNTQKSSYDLFPRAWVEHMLCPPLVEGFDEAIFRVRLLTASAQSCRDASGQEVLRFELYRPETPSKGPLISCAFAGAPLTGFSAPDSAECVFSIKGSVLQRYVQNCAGIFKRHGAILEINRTQSSCFMFIHNTHMSSMVELLPGEYKAHHEDMRLSFRCCDLLSAAGKTKEADFQICRFTGMQDRNSKVRFSVSDRLYDCECDWGHSAEVLKESFLAAKNTRPIVVAGPEIWQAALLLRARKLGKIRLRLHHKEARMTLFSGSRLPPNQQYSGEVAVVSCNMPPSQNGISSWCVNAKDLFQVARSMKEADIRIFPVHDALILLDSDEPFIRHRLPCLQPDDLGEEVERRLMDVETSMVNAPEPY